MDKVKKHFQDEAAIFDAQVLKMVPFYNDMIEALVLAMPFTKNKTIKVVDVGCGTGTISKTIKKHYPHAKITCVDFADNMIRIAKNKLKDHTDIDYIVSDFRDFDYRGYDAVLSSLTLHHVRSGNEKKSFYKKIFKEMNRKGVFYVADLALGSSDYLQNLNLIKWKEFMLQSVSEEQITECKKRYDEEDSPFRLIDELSWLNAARFQNIDVVWKYYHFAVYGGQKE